MTWRNDVQIAHAANAATVQSAAARFSQALLSIVATCAFDAGRTLIQWQERASQRAQIASLDAAALRDIGINRDQAMAEARKPFWKA